MIAFPGRGSLRRWVPTAFATAVLLAPCTAHATLLVRSDGNGLLIQDKNGLNDIVIVTTTNHSDGPYDINSRNPADVIRFDRQFGCSDQGFDTVFCQRGSSAIRIELVGGNDQLFMTTAPAGNATILGGAGNDDLGGHPGADTINGQTGEDELTGQTGVDVLQGGSSSDTVRGDDGDDEVKGGPGSDVLSGGGGEDVILGEEDNDGITSKEPDFLPAARDTVGCSSGFDRVEADLQDRLFSCEEVDRSPVGETNVHILARTLRVARDGRVRVRLRCPREVGALGCNGRLRLRLDRRRSGSSRSRAVRYRIRAARRRTVGLRLTATDVRRIGRLRRARGVLTSVERGLKGPKTTIRKPRLRLR